MAILSVYTCCVDFREFMNQKYIKWRADKIGAAGSISSWGREMGFNAQVLNGWMNRGSIPRADSIAKLADCLGQEVYEVLGLKSSDELLLGKQLLSAGLDTDWVSAFLSAKASPVDNAI